MGQALVFSEHEDKVQNRYKEKTYQVRLYDIHAKCKLSRMPESLDKYHYPKAKVISIRLSDRQRYKIRIFHKVLLMIS